MLSPLQHTPEDATSNTKLELGAATHSLLMQLVDGTCRQETELLANCQRALLTDAASDGQRLAAELAKGVGLGRYRCLACGVGLAHRYRAYRSLVTGGRLHTGGFTSLRHLSGCLASDDLQLVVFW